MSTSEPNLSSEHPDDLRGDRSAGSAVGVGEDTDAHWLLGAPVPDRSDRLRPAAAGALSALIGSCGVLVQVARDAPGHPGALAGLVLVALVAVGLQQLDLGRRWPTALVPPLLLAAAVAATQPAVGRTPFVVVAVSTTLASGALCRWRPLPGWPQRSTPAAALALPPLLALQFLWWRHSSVVAAAVLWAVAVAALEVHARFPAAATRTAGRLARTIEAVASALAAGLVALIALPLLYLPGAIVRGWVRMTGDRWGLRGGWQVTDPVPDHSRESVRLFATTPARTRRRRHRVSAVVAMAGVGAAVLVAIWIVPADDASRSPRLVGDRSQVEPGAVGERDELDRDLFALEFAVPYSSLPAYRDAPWADQLQQDQGQLVDWDDDVRTRYFNSDDGVRRTLRSTCDGCPTATVWLSGGSAVVGLGQRDDHTIASELVRIGDANGLALEVVNLGRNGQSMIEEVAQIEELLATTQPPDLIVFLNGWNDVIIRVAFSFVYGPDPAAWADLNAMTHLQSINDRPDEFLASGIGPRVGRDAADLYASLQDEVDRAAAARGVGTAYFFQPDALVDDSQLSGYEEITNLSADELMGSPFAVALQAATTRLGDRVENLRPLFAGAEQPVFAGLVHQNEAGARMTAEAVFRQLEPELRRVAR